MRSEVLPEVVSNVTERKSFCRSVQSVASVIVRMPLLPSQLPPPPDRTSPDWNPMEISAVASGFASEPLTVREGSTVTGLPPALYVVSPEEVATFAADAVPQTSSAIAKAIKIAMLHHLPPILLQASIISSNICSRSGCASVHAAAKSVGCVIYSVYNRSVLSGVLSVSHELTPLHSLLGPEGFTHNSQVDHPTPI